MSRLRIFNDNAPQAPLLATDDRAEMAAELARIGVDFEQWDAAQPVLPGDPPDAIMAAYRTDIDRLIEAKMEDLHNLTGPMTDDRIRLREEVAEQIKALKA